MNKEEIFSNFVNYTTSKALKDIGYNEPSFAFWKHGIDDLKPVLVSNVLIDKNRLELHNQTANTILAPLKQQAIDFIFKKTNILIKQEKLFSPRRLVWVCNDTEDFFNEIAFYEDINGLFEKILKLKKKMLIKITKLEELPDARHPNNIDVGFEKQLEIEEGIVPMLGMRFPQMSYWSTSIVTEIIDDNTFRTLNSIYKWELIN